MGDAAAIRPAGLNDREQAELIRGLYRNLPVVVVCMLIGAAATCAGLIYLAPQRASATEAWLGLGLAIAGGQLGLWGWQRRVGMADAHWRRWGRRLVLASFADGARWGLATVWLAAGDQPDQMMWVCMVSGGAACASVASVGSYTPAYYALLVPAIVPFMLRSLTLNDPRYWGVAVLGGVVLLGMAWLGRRQSRTLVEALRLRFENLDLARDLGRQRDVAEQANLAKAQILAAASHDLRQPMHALGMLVAALRRSRLAPDSSLLVGQIEEAVEAMNGLFDGLLDISRLDAGITEPAPRAFLVGPLLDRICREHTAHVGDRPVRLRWVASGATVRTDPALLERMLRNLVSNAVRYTESGRILVGCRRRGARLSIEVWDTGPGLALEDQQRIFEAFVQLGNPERDRTKGLGLGLAITHRLAELLDCPVTLRSQPGRGAMFAVSAPMAPAEPEASAPPQDASARAGLVFVVDDERLVRESTARLLGSWGYRTIVASSAEELLSVAATARPDLIICDWRLRGDETAPVAIESIRRAAAAAAPALIITGDIAPERLRAIREAGFAALHKPVAPAKLRAAVGNLIREQADPAGAPPRIGLGP